MFLRVNKIEDEKAPSNQVSSIRKASLSESLMMPKYKQPSEGNFCTKEEIVDPEELDFPVGSHHFGQTLIYDGKLVLMTAKPSQEGVLHDVFEFDGKYWNRTFRDEV